MSLSVSLCVHVPGPECVCVSVRSLPVSPRQYPQACEGVSVCLCRSAGECLHICVSVCGQGTAGTGLYQRVYAFVCVPLMCVFEHVSVFECPGVCVIV